MDDDLENLEEDEQEPIGQDLDALQRQKEAAQKRKLAQEVIKDEAGSGADSDDVSNEEYDQHFAQQAARAPQAKASAKPGKGISAGSLNPQKNPPGGVAIKPKSFSERVRSLARRGKTGGAEGESATGGGASQAAKQVANKLAENLKKAGNAIKSIGKFLAKSGPWGWIIGAIIIILIIVLFIVGISYMGTLNSKLPATSGGTQPILLKPTDPTDSATLSNFLKISGDKDVANQNINETLDKIKTDIGKIKDDAIAQNDPNKDAIVSQADIALASLEVLGSTKSLESAQSALKQIGDLYNLFEDGIPVYSGTTRMPVAGTISQFNTDLHGFSFLHYDAVESHNVYIRDTNNKEKCDAVDIGVNFADPVYPIFGGTITDVSSDGTDNGKKVMIKDGDYSILYAHLTNITKNKGDAITVSDILGVAKGNNLQIETMYQNRCLVTTHADMIDHAEKDRRHQDWGGYLWDRIVVKFKLK